jgi:hypothetical protein
VSYALSPQPMPLAQWRASVVLPRCIPGFYRHFLNLPRLCTPICIQCSQSERADLYCVLTRSSWKRVVISDFVLSPISSPNSPLYISETEFVDWKHFFRVTEKRNSFIFSQTLKSTHKTKHKTTYPAGWLLFIRNFVLNSNRDPGKGVVVPYFPLLLQILRPGKSNPFYK